jgi:cytoskeletal protein RodZ
MNVKFLPGRAYTIPYIKSYAQLVGLDPQALLAQFLRESALTREDVQPQLRNPESKPRRERPWLVALAAAMVAIGFIAWQAVRDRTTEIKSAAAPTTNARYNQPATPEAATPIVTEPVAPVGVAPVIELVATEQAWLEVRGAEGTIFLSRDLKPGDRYRPDVGVGWTLHAKDGGAFAVTIDGQPVGVLGEKGSPVLGRHVDTMAEAMKPKAPVAAPSQG